MAKAQNKRPSKSIIYDRVHPSDFLGLNMVYCCEQCTHFKHSDQTCTLGYESKYHLQKNQVEHYHLSGRVAFCRFLEVD